MCGEFGFIVEDGKAVFETISTTGMGGNSMCFACANVMGRADPDLVQRAAVGTGIVHLSCTETKRFRKHDSESFNALADVVQAARLELGVGAFANLCTMTGFHYDASAWPWDHYIRNLAPLPGCMYPDSMHTLLSSGGSLQYSMNKACNVIGTTLGIPMIVMDEFTTSVNFPRRNTRPPTDFFRARVVRPTERQADVHLKAFASDVLLTSEILTLFSRLDLAPERLCLDVARYVEASHDLLIVLRDGQPGDADLLDAVVLVHADEFASFCPEGVKPKFHTPFHFGDYWRFHNKKANCFAGERQHKIPKSMEAFRAFGAACLRKAARKLFETWSDPDTFEPFLLTALEKEITAASRVLDSFGDVRCAWRAASMLTPHAGALLKNDLLFWCDDEEKRMGTAKDYMKVLWSDGSIKFFGVVAPHAPKGLGWWELVPENDMIVVPIEKVCAVTFVACESSGLYPLL